MVHSGIHSAHIYYQLLRIAFLSNLQYRADFLIGMLGVVTENLVNLLAIGVILGKFFDLAGWTIWEIVFLYGLWMTAHSSYSLPFAHLYQLEDYIITGSFDTFLIRPLNPLWMVLTTDVNINALAGLSFGVVSLWLAITKLNLSFSLAQWVYLGIMLVSAVLIELGMMLALASATFWTTRSSGLIYLVNQFNANMIQQYPLEMFGQRFRFLVSSLIPVAFINYYPTRFLLGKTASGDPDYFLSFLSPVVGVVFLLLAVKIWRWGLKQYRSTGS